MYPNIMGQTLATMQQYTCSPDTDYDESYTHAPMPPVPHVPSMPPVPPMPSMPSMPSMPIDRQQNLGDHNQMIQQTAKLFNQSLRGMPDNNTPNTPPPDHPATYTKPPARVYPEVIRATIDALQQNLADLRTENDQLVRQNHILAEQLAGLRIPDDKKMNITSPDHLANYLHQPSPHHGHEPVV